VLGWDAADYPELGKPSSTKRPSTRPTPLARRSTTSSPPPLLPGCTNHHGLRRRSIPRCPSGHPRRSARGPTAREQPERIPAVQFRRARNATQIPDWDRSLVIRLTRSRNRRDSPTGSKQVWGEFEHVLSLVLRHHHGETGEQTEEDDQHRDRQGLLRTRLAAGVERWLSGNVDARLPVLVSASALTDLPLAQALATAVNTDLAAYGLIEELPPGFFADRPQSRAGWLILVDGLDEVADSRARQRVLNKLAAVSTREHSALYRFIVATRPLPDGELDLLDKSGAPTPHGTSLRAKAV
jgi:hypothetical protein